MVSSNYYHNESIANYNSYGAGREPPRIMPFERNPRFTGRELTLLEIGKILFQSNRTTKAAIIGLGGVGKTQVAIELVHRVMEEHKDCSVFWISAIDIESLHQGYLAVAQKLNIPGWNQDGTDVKGLVEDYLSRGSVRHWLLVFDNADDIDMWMQPPASKEGADKRLIDYLPRSTRGNILFTTRDRRAAVKLAHQNIVRLQEMSKDISKELLQKCLIDSSLVDSDNSTGVLLEQLTYLPLAIVQASAYINENGISIADYVSLLAEKDKSTIELLSEDFEDDGRYRNIKNPVATTWLISFEQISQKDTLAAEYLSFMACIEPKDIPESLLPIAPSRKKQLDAIGTLNAYSFVNKRPGGSVLDLHRLVHIATRKWLIENGQMAEWTSKTIIRLAEIFPSDENENRHLWRAYLPHASYILQSPDTSGDQEYRVQLSNKFGMCLLSDGRYKEAENFLKDVTEWRVKALGQEHPATLTSMNNLAWVLDSQGEYEKAEAMNRQTLEFRKQALGQEHPDTLTSMSNLALVLNSQGKYKEAEAMNRQALNVSEKALGQEHPDTLTSMSNLALMLNRQGKYEEAEAINRRTLNGCEKALGLEHPDTLTSMNNLAGVLNKQGKYKEAEALNRWTLKLREKALGLVHPDTLTSMNNLAGVLTRQSEYEQAEALNRQTLELREKALGHLHPDTLTSMSNLAFVFKRQGKYKEAEVMNQRTLELRENVLGQEHPSTLTSMNNLAWVLNSRGK